MNLKDTVITISKAMSIDYASQFNKAYKDESDLILLKKRMWQGLKDIDCESSLAAYQELCDETPEYMPTLQSIISRAKSVNSKNIRAGQELIERERLAALPPPTHAIDVIEELAKAQLGENATSHDILLERHYQLIAQDKRKGLIRSPNRGSEATCAVNHCRKAGSVTGSLKGSDNWYCPEHARLS